jgi:hypothetical protein
MKTCVICSKELQGNQTKYCCNNCKQKAHNTNVKRQHNTYHSQYLRAWSRKLKYIEILGGACSECGYKNNIAALEFNHIDPNNKAMKLDARKLSNTKEETLLQELGKCNLLCANCHREHHYPEMELSNVMRICSSVGGAPTS